MKQETLTVRKSRTIDGKGVEITAKGVPNNPVAIAKAEAALEQSLNEIDVSKVKKNKTSLIKRVGNVSFIFLKNHIFDNAEFIVAGFGLNVAHNPKGGKTGFRYTTWKSLAVFSTNRVTIAFKWNPRKQIS